MSLAFNGATVRVSLDQLTDVALTDAAQGDLLYRGATEWVNLGAGSDGQFLKTQGPGADPMWATLTGVTTSPGASATNVITPSGATVRALGIVGAASQSEVLQGWYKDDQANAVVIAPQSFFGSGATPGLALLGNTDQATNYQQSVFYQDVSNQTWLMAQSGGTATNTLIVGSRRAKSGSGTDIVFDAVNGRMSFRSSHASQLEFLFPSNKTLTFSPDVRTGAVADAMAYQAFATITSAGAGNQFRFVRYGATFAPTSGTVKFTGAKYDFTVNQTGTATGDYTALEVNVTETAATGTNKLLLDLRRGDQSRFAVDRAGSMIQAAGNGSLGIFGTVQETLTLSTAGTTTDTTLDLPAGSLILAVTARVTTTIATATDWQLGDPTVADRFSDANSTLTAGTTVVGMNHWKADRTTAGQGAGQASDAKVRVTTTGTPTAGALRITVHYLQLKAPTA